MAYNISNISSCFTTFFKLFAHAYKRLTEGIDSLLTIYKVNVFSEDWIYVFV